MIALPFGLRSVVPTIFGVFSVSPSEMVTIAIVALLVFGPQKLPEIARKLGRIGREVSRAAQEFRAGIEREYDDATQPLQEVRRQLGATIDDTKPKRTVDDAPSGIPAPEDAASDEAGE